MGYTWHWIFHSETLQCDCAAIHYKKSSKEILSTLCACIEQALTNKPGGEDKVLFIKDTPTAIKFPVHQNNPAIMTLNSVTGAFIIKSCIS